MKYFWINSKIEKKIVGKFPQSTEVIDMGQIQEDFLVMTPKITVDFKLPIIKLEPKAKLTSLLSVVAVPSWFIVIDSNFAEFLKKSIKQDNQIFPLMAFQNGIEINGYQLFILNGWHQTKYIDFKQSKFTIGKYFDYNFRGFDISIRNFEEYQEKTKQLETEKLYLNPLEICYDFSNSTELILRFANVNFGKTYAVSESLKIQIEENEFTGIDFIPIEQFDNRFKVNY